jgi:hypothetical protein
MRDAYPRHTCSNRSSRGRRNTMRLLVITTEPITAEQVRDALPGEAQPQDSEVMVVAPALQQDALHFWMSDADEAIANADRIRRETVARLDEQGVAASGDTGESDPEQAIQDALQSFPADRIVLFTHPESDRAYKEDLDAKEIEERFGVPVDHALTS